MSATDPGAEPVPERGGAYTYAGAIRWEYSPELDHEPDPGEIVWTWVAFEEDSSVGKDRPVAVVGRAEDERLVALMLSSRSHHGDRDWMSIGSGPWDREGRESWVRKDRILAVHPPAVRREGAILPRPTFDRIVASIGGSAPAKAPTLIGRLRCLFAR
jgi:hypothetical protein